MSNNNNNNNTVDEGEDIIPSVSELGNAKKFDKGRGKVLVSDASKINQQPTNETQKRRKEKRENADRALANDFSTPVQQYLYARDQRPSQNSELRPHQRQLVTRIYRFMQKAYRAVSKFILRAEKEGKQWTYEQLLHVFDCNGRFMRVNWAMSSGKATAIALICSQQIGEKKRRAMVQYLEPWPKVIDFFTTNDKVVVTAKEKSLVHEATKEGVHSGYDNLNPEQHGLKTLDETSMVAKIKVPKAHAKMLASKVLELTGDVQVKDVDDAWVITGCLKKVASVIQEDKIQEGSIAAVVLDEPHKTPSPGKDPEEKKGKDYGGYSKAGYTRIYNQLRTSFVILTTATPKGWVESGFESIHFSDQHIPIYEVSKRTYGENLKANCVTTFKLIQQKFNYAFNVTYGDGTEGVVRPVDTDLDEQMRHEFRINPELWKLHWFPILKLLQHRQNVSGVHVKALAFTPSPSVKNDTDKEDGDDDNDGGADGEGDGAHPQHMCEVVQNLVDEHNLISPITNKKFVVAYLSSSTKSTVESKGQSPADRARIQDDFRNGKIDILINYKICSEGFSEETIGIVVNFAKFSMESHSSYNRCIQALIGRGCRTICKDNPRLQRIASGVMNEVTGDYICPYWKPGLDNYEEGFLKNAFQKHTIFDASYSFSSTEKIIRDYLNHQGAKNAISNQLDADDEEIVAKAVLQQDPVAVPEQTDMDQQSLDEEQESGDDEMLAREEAHENDVKAFGDFRNETFQQSYSINQDGDGVINFALKKTPPRANQVDTQYIVLGRDRHLDSYQILHDVQVKEEEEGVLSFSVGMDTINAFKAFKVKATRTSMSTEFNVQDETQESRNTQLLKVKEVDAIITQLKEEAAAAAAAAIAPCTSESVVVQDDAVMTDADNVSAQQHASGSPSMSNDGASNAKGRERRSAFNKANKTLLSTGSEHETDGEDEDEPPISKREKRKLDTSKGDEASYNGFDYGLEEHDGHDDEEDEDDEEEGDEEEEFEEEDDDDEEYDDEEYEEEEFEEEEQDDEEDEEDDDEAYVDPEEEREKKRRRQIERLHSDEDEASDEEKNEKKKRNYSKRPKITGFYMGVNFASTLGSNAGSSSSSSATENALNSAPMDTSVYEMLPTTDKNSGDVILGLEKVKDLARKPTGLPEVPTSQSNNIKLYKWSTDVDTYYKSCNPPEDFTYVIENARKAFDQKAAEGLIRIDRRTDFIKRITMAVTSTMNHFASNGKQIPSMHYIVFEMDLNEIRNYVTEQHNNKVASNCDGALKSLRLWL